jgi:hypothetical protein
MEERFLQVGFCPVPFRILTIYRHLTLARNAFAGTPTLMRMTMTAEEAREAAFTSDIMYVISCSNFVSYPTTCAEGTYLK